MTKKLFNHTPKIPKLNSTMLREFIHEFILTATNYFLISIIKKVVQKLPRSIYKRILQIINKRHIIFVL